MTLICRNEILKEMQDIFNKDGDYCDFTIAGITVDEIERVGGEDQGSDYHIVWKVTDGNSEMFVKVDGNYSSWDSTEFEPLYEVVAHQRVVTVTDWIKA